MVCLAETATALEPGTRVDAPFTGRRPFVLDIHGGFTWWGLGIATGARFGIPIVHNGFIGKLNNSFSINFGADFYYIRPGGRLKKKYYPALGFPIAAHWEFYFTERWSAFGEVGLNIFLHPNVFHDEKYAFYPGHWFLFAVGGRLHFNDVVAMTLRLGNPYISIGVSFFF